jgi:hypothetical protein
MSHIPAATAAALPPELPPAESGSIFSDPGFLTVPYIENVECELTMSVTALSS